MKQGARGDEQDAQGDRRNHRAEEEEQAPPQAGCQGQRDNDGRHLAPPQEGRHSTTFREDFYMRGRKDQSTAFREEFDRMGARRSGLRNAPRQAQRQFLQREGTTRVIWGSEGAAWRRRQSRLERGRRGGGGALQADGSNPLLMSPKRRATERTTPLSTAQQTYHRRGEERHARKWPKQEKEPHLHRWKQLRPQPQLRA